MSKKPLIILIAIVLIITLIFLWLFYFGRDEALPEIIPEVNTGSLPTTKATVNVNTSTVPVITPLPIIVEEAGQVELTRLAATFVERLGSFSNQSHYENLKDLEVFMTANMQKWAQDFVANLLGDESGGDSEYHGITTKALKTEVIEYEENSQALILVYTQRQEFFGNSSNAKIYYQNISLDFLKEGGEWKVDSAYWQE